MRVYMSACVCTVFLKKKKIAKPITNDSTKKEKYNMILDFCKNDLTPNFHNTIKPIVIIATNQV
jgi:hypothetical protein